MQERRLPSAFETQIFGVVVPEATASRSSEVYEPRHTDESLRCTYPPAIRAGRLLGFALHSAGSESISSPERELEAGLL